MYFQESYGHLLSHKLLAAIPLLPYCPCESEKMSTKRALFRFGKPFFVKHFLKNLTTCALPGCF
jgi:hypothetical protein